MIFFGYFYLIKDNLSLFISYVSCRQASATNDVFDIAFSGLKHSGLAFLVSDNLRFPVRTKKPVCYTENSDLQFTNLTM